MLVFIALGSNLGKREKNISQAITQLAEHPQVTIQTYATIIETAPLGPQSQPHYLNTVLKLETSLAPEQLLDLCQDIEKKLGRQPNVRWGARTIDLDILLFGSLVFKNERLQIPHPEMTKRDFVLQPLNEIATDARHPILQKTIAEIYKTLNNKPNK